MEHRRTQLIGLFNELDELAINKHSMLFDLRFHRPERTLGYFLIGQFE